MSTCCIKYSLYNVHSNSYSNTSMSSFKKHGNFQIQKNSVNFFRPSSSTILNDRQFLITHSDMVRTTSAFVSCGMSFFGCFIFLQHLCLTKFDVLCLYMNTPLQFLHPTTFSRKPLPVPIFPHTSQTLLRPFWRTIWYCLVRSLDLISLKFVCSVSEPCDKLKDLCIRNYLCINKMIYSELANKI